MLRYSRSPGGAGFGLNLANAPGGLAPPDLHGMLAEEYRGYLRALYRRKPGLFLEQARFARDQGCTLSSVDRPDLAEVLYDALVKVAALKGWDIAGGELSASEPDKSGRYVPR